MTPDLFWIPGPWRGRLAIAARPRGGDWLDDEVRNWRRAGIDLVISLLEENEAAQLDLLDESRAAENLEIAFISFPIADRDIPASTEAAISVIRNIVTQVEAGKSIAVHCRQGIGRSGLITAGVLVTEGILAEEAMRVVSAARGVSIPETSEQRRWIEQLPTTVPVAKET